VNGPDSTTSVDKPPASDTITNGHTESANANTSPVTANTPYRAA
jgi:hypothetical protein